jgi:hypothetical protein
MPTGKTTGTEVTNQTRTAPRTARLNRRRYSEIVRLLKEVINNEKAGLARRMKAAETLLGVYDRHDRAIERKEARRNAAEKGNTTLTSANDPETETTQALLDAEAQERTRAIFDDLLKPEEVR